MKANELRQQYLDFFKSKGHAIITSASLIPDNDPTVLFTTAGMHPLVPYLMGEKHPEGNRLVNAQKCIRTSDIDEVGDTVHHTFFEMLGNWSLGNYFKKEAITWSWEFLTDEKWINLDKNRIAVSVFAGDADAPFDQEAYNIWKEIDIASDRIAKLPKKDNWWGPAGITGPCGPDTEMFYWAGSKYVPEKFYSEDKKWVEIWNDVFMQYYKNENGIYKPLPQQNVDTGMGLERTLAVINGLDDNYQSELFINIIKKIEELSDKKYGHADDITRAMRIIADHIKASVFIIGDDKGIAPSNTDQGYIVRRLIRRAIRYGKQLEIEKQLWTKDLAQIIINDYKEAYPELEKNKNFIFKNLEIEENKFSKTLVIGERKIALTNTAITGTVAFNLYQTYGFPLEMTKEIIAKKGLKIINEEDFQKELKRHQDLSRTASAGKFKGGLADASEETKKLHTAAHLLLASLRKVLGDHVQQKGSNITPERLRFDFSHPNKLTDEQKNEVEKLVNEAINANLPVIINEMPLFEAKKGGAIGVFTSKYGERVKVYIIGDSLSGQSAFSKEICGGPHADRTGRLGKFKIKKEQSSSAGVRRIKAILLS